MCRKASLSSSSLQSRRRPLFVGLQVSHNRVVDPSDFSNHRPGPDPSVTHHRRKQRHDMKQLDCMQQLDQPRGAVKVLILVLYEICIMDGFLQAKGSPLMCDVCDVCDVHNLAPRLRDAREV